MLLFQKRFHEGLVAGSVTVTFRRWERPHVKPGGRYRCHPIGVLQVDRIDRVRAADITDLDARRSGFASRHDLVEYIRSGPGGELRDDSELFRVAFHHGGEEDRIDIALEDDLGADDIEAIASRLARLDAKGAWTSATLSLIEKHPRVAASRLAAQLGRETLPFKVDVRKLKHLGLTQSFEVGYEVSPRGRAYRKATARRGPGASKPRSRGKDRRPAR